MRKLILILLTLGLAQTAFAAPTAPPPDEATRQIMHQVFDAIAYLLPLSVRPEGKASHWDRELIEQKLATLERASDALAAHAEAGDQAFSGLAKSFKTSSHEIAAGFRDAWPSYAYFSLMELTQHCVACHGRLPASAQANFGQRLMARIDTAGFDESELAQLYVATRQFDAALGALEHKLLYPGASSAVELDNGGILLDYLEVALVVLRDPVRASGLLEKFAGRADVPGYLAKRLQAWQDSLKTLAPTLAGPASLPAARALFTSADSLTRAPRGRARAIHDLVAMSLLERYVAARQGSAEEMAEAWYMLGVIALRSVEPKYSVPEMEIMLAAAVRAAPRGPHAGEAYDLLEEFGYWRDQPLSGEAAKDAPVDMAGLRALMAAH